MTRYCSDENAQIFSTFHFERKEQEQKDEFILPLISLLEHAQSLFYFVSHSYYISLKLAGLIHCQEILLFSDDNTGNEIRKSGKVADILTCLDRGLPYILRCNQAI